MTANLLKRRHLFVMLIITTIALYFGGVVWSGGNSNVGKNKQTKIKLSNRTKNCQFVSADKQDGIIKLAIKNNSSKNITAFVLSSYLDAETVFTLKEELLTADVDMSIAPSGVYEKSFVMPSSSSPSNTFSLDLSAIIFDDKTSEGDQKLVQEIADERYGEKIQYTQSIRVLDSLLNMEDKKMVTYFNNKFHNDLTLALTPSENDLLVQLKKDKVNQKSISRQDTNELPEQVKIGLKNGSFSITSDFKQLENSLHNSPSFREKITRKKQIYERIVSQL